MDISIWLIGIHLDHALIARELSRESFPPLSCSLISATVEVSRFRLYPEVLKLIINELNPFGIE
jgi:hypothetical protein